MVQFPRVMQPVSTPTVTAEPRHPTVLQVLPSLVTGGVERGTIEITQAIAGAGGTALVASAGGRLVPAIERAGGRHITLPLSRKDPLAVWRNAARLEALIRAEQVAIVHARSRAPAWSAWLACRRTGAHFVTTWHGTYNEDLPLKRQYNAVMARGERVIAASRFIAELIVARHGTDPGVSGSFLAGSIPQCSIRLLCLAIGGRGCCGRGDWRTACARSCCCRGG